MLVGLTQFVLTRRYLSPVDLGVPVNTRLAAWLPVIAFALAGSSLPPWSCRHARDRPRLAVGRASSWLIGLLAACYFVYLFFFRGMTVPERHRAYVMLALFIASTFTMRVSSKPGPRSLYLPTAIPTATYWDGRCRPASCRG